MNTKASEFVPEPRESGIKRWMTVLGPFAGLVAIILFFAVLTGSPERYLAPFNIRIILSQTVIVAISAIGMTLVIISGGKTPFGLIVSRDYGCSEKAGFNSNYLELKYL